MTDDTDEKCNRCGECSPDVVDGYCFGCRLTLHFG